MALKMRPPRLATQDSRRLQPRGFREPHDHLGTEAHRRWALAVIRASGGICQWPGGCSERRSLVADHVIERRDDPSRALDPTNGVALCRRHHTEKTIAERVKRMSRT